MKNSIYLAGLVVLLAVSGPAFAQSALAEFSAELLSTVIYSAVGIVMGGSWVLRWWIG